MRERAPTPMVDSVREIRAMILVALHLPPLPLVVSKVDPDSMQSSECVVTTSHSIIAECLNAAAMQNDKRANAVRQKRQQANFRRFLHALAERGFEFGAKDLYELYCTFTRDHVNTFFPENARTEGLRFMPYDYMTKGDGAHKRLCEWVEAQSILFEDPDPVKSEDLAGTELSELLFMSRARFGRVATMEDRKLIREKEEQLEQEDTTSNT